MWVCVYVLGTLENLLHFSKINELSCLFLAYQPNSLDSVDGDQLPFDPVPVRYEAGKLPNQTCTQ